MKSLENLFLIYQVHSHKDGLHPIVAGKFYLDSEHFEVLEDNVGWLEKLHDKPPGDAAKVIWRLANAMYYRVVNMEDLKQGLHPDLIHEAPATPGPESRFAYHKLGMPSPQILDFQGDSPSLDGHPLNDDELQYILQNVQRKHATIKYHDEMEKAEEFFLDLLKADDLIALRKTLENHEDAKEFNREMMTDSEVRSMGNLKAFRDFAARPSSGIHIALSSNDHFHLRNTAGAKASVAAVVSLGKAISDAAKESGKSKTFRTGRDAFHVFVQNHDDAASFARNLRAKLEAIPALDNHQLSTSMGFGPTPEHAHFGLIEAKNARKASGLPPGQAKSHAHSMVPGHEGPIPVSADLPDLS